jgi:hypothetical protein
MALLPLICWLLFKAVLVSILVSRTGKEQEEKLAVHEAD